MLQRITSSPFDDHPELLQIWPHRTTELARDMKDCLEHPDEEQSFLILHGDTVVGITGFYRYDDAVGLNWHGIIDKFNGLGYGRQALEELIPLAAAAYPLARYIVEELPVNKEQRLRGFFEKAGFKHTGVLVNKPWVTADTDWVEYRREL